ncbi:MAG: M1 family peptidase [Gemmatimonadales bacterium]|jgi:aminopeptidase N|nr:M1 family peptidase [Gemmatimonadales bacterium]MDG2239814.1 M1 family aminopeptidase [Longimicrobiales bacterium]NCG33610.1 M1 family peptidase [Pseudomonadota bacterium]MBT3499322.1 M1 family peptidase [Gemmatimonadales bacterium]MBT3775909.1 M1 family peptidase [Gemmatimonadales bacterium]
MRAWRSALVIGLVLVAAASSSTPDDYPRRIGIDIEHYRFELALADDSDEIAGRATVTVLFTGSGVVDLPLDLTSIASGGRGMEVLSVMSDGASLDFTHRSDVLNIRLAETGRAGGRVSVTIDYRGVPVAGLQIGPNKYGDRTFFSDNWPNRVHNWLPTVDHVGEKATSEFLVTAPAHYQVVSNGLVLEETDLGNGNRLTHWKQSVPISPWLFVLGVARFAVQQVDDFQGKQIQTWVYAQDRDAGFYDFAVPTKQVLEFYDEYVGPFAYEKLANITSPATGGGMEAASAIMYSDNSVTGERTDRWRNVVIHEIAHQWFGNAVTEADWDDVWLSEGFATYFTLLYREHAYGRDDFVSGLQQAADRIWPMYVDAPEYRIVHDDLADMALVTSGITYQKGAWVLHMLRKRMGDEAFWEGIRTYYARYMNGTTSTDQFMEVMEEASGQDHQVFFDQWLRQGGNPSLQGWWVYDETAQAVRVELNQVQDVGSFVMPLEIGVDMDGDQIADVMETVEITGDLQRFVISVPGEPVNVRLDPDTWALFQSDFGPRGR